MRKYYSLILSILAVVSVFIPINAHADNKYGIVIDGAFSDWSGLPMTELSFRMKMDRTSNMPVWSPMKQIYIFI